MSQSKGLTISAQEEATLYFVGLVAVYLASYSPPLGAPGAVRTIFGLFGTMAIIVKYELASQPKPQITTHQALYSTIALVLSVAGGQLSSLESSYWYAGLAVAVIGAVLAAYEDLSGTTPSGVVSAAPPAPPVVQVIQPVLHEIPATTTSPPTWGYVVTYTGTTSNAGSTHS